MLFMDSLRPVGCIFLLVAQQCRRVGSDSLRRGSPASIRRLLGTPAVRLSQLPAKFQTDLHKYTANSSGEDENIPLGNKLPQCLDVSTVVGLLGNKHPQCVEVTVVGLLLNKQLKV